MHMTRKIDSHKKGHRLMTLIVHVSLFDLTEIRTSCKLVR